LSGGKDSDLVFGGRGNDEVHGNTGDDSLAGGTGNDLLMGEAGDDVLFGGAGNDRVFGGSGSDYVVASSGNDTMSGGSGDDTLDFSRMSGSLSIDLGKHTASVGSGNAFHASTVSGFEAVIGTTGNDVFVGDRNDTLLMGGAGNDLFRGKLGADTLVGGDGADVFVELKKDTADGSVDKIADFQVGSDRLDFSDFLKGHTSYEQSVRFVDASNADGAATMVQGLVKGIWTNVVTLSGINMGDVGADHHALTYSDLGLLA
jgi:large repetitive protein